MTRSGGESRFGWTGVLMEAVEKFLRVEGGKAIALGVFLAILSVVANGSFAVLSKTRSMRHARVSALIFNFWACLGVVLSSLLVLFKYKFVFALQGILSGVFFVLFFINIFRAIRLLGVSVSYGIWAGTTAVVSFMARQLLEGPSKRFFLAGLAIIVTVVGIVGVAFLGHMSWEPQEFYEDDDHTQALIQSQILMGETPSRSFSVGVFSAVLAGILGALVMVPAAIAPDEAEGNAFLSSFETKSYSDPYELHDSIQNVDCVGGQQEAAGDEGKSNRVLEEDKNTFLEEKVHDSADVSEEKVNDSTAVVEEKVAAVVEEKVAAVVEEKVAAVVEEKVAAVVEEKAAAIVEEKVLTVVEETVAATKDNNIVILQDEDKVVDLEEQPIETSSSLKSSEGGDGAGAQDDELALDRLHAAISTPKVSPRQRLPRKGKEAKSTVRKELVPKPQLTRTRQTENKKKHKFEIGQTVSLLNPAKPKQVVAVGKIMSVGGGPGPQQYHRSPIPNGWYRLDVVSAQEGSVDLMAPNEAGDEFTVKDVVGGNTIWQEKYIGMAQAGKLVVYKPPK